MKIIFERPALPLFKSHPRWYNTHNRNFADKEAFPMKKSVLRSYARDRKSTRLNSSHVF